MKTTTKIFKKINFVLLALALAAILLELKFSYISEDVFFRFIINISVCLILYLVINKINILNKLASHIVFFLILSLNVFFISRQVFVIDGYVIATPPNFKGVVYIKMNDKSSDVEIRPFNGVVVFPINSKGQLFTKSNFNVSEFALFSMEYVNGKLVDNGKLKLTDVKINRKVLNGITEIVITGNIR